MFDSNSRSVTACDSQVVPIDDIWLLSPGSKIPDPKRSNYIFWFSAAVSGHKCTLVYWALKDSDPNYYHPKWLPSPSPGCLPLSWFTSESSSMSLPQRKSLLIQTLNPCAVCPTATEEPLFDKEEFRRMWTRWWIMIIASTAAAATVRDGRHVTTW